MNEEFNDLFDIKEGEVEKQSVQITTQKVVIHTLIRTVILLVVVVATCVLLFIAAYDSQIGLGILALVIVVGWFSLMIMEAIRLNKGNKTQLSTANSILVGLAVLMIFMLILGVN